MSQHIFLSTGLHCLSSEPSGLSALSADNALYRQAVRELKSKLRDLLANDAGTLKGFQMEGPNHCHQTDGRIFEQQAFVSGRGKRYHVFGSSICLNFNALFAFVKNSMFQCPISFRFLLVARISDHPIPSVPHAQSARRTWRISNAATPSWSSTRRVCRLHMHLHLLLRRRCSRCRRVGPLVQFRRLGICRVVINMPVVAIAAGVRTAPRHCKCRRPLIISDRSRILRSRSPHAAHIQH